MTERVACGPTDDDAECACGCTGWEDRCAYWVDCYEVGKEVDGQHRCCKVFST